MPENLHTLDDLRMRQALPLSMKLAMTKTRIRDWVNYYGEDGVYISFSGGKDSTVLLHIVREMYPSIEAVFVDTGLEYPEIREFVKTFDNVTWLKPKMQFKKVIEHYGYPFISKEVSQTIWEIQSRMQKGLSPESHYRWKKLNGEAIDKKTGKKSMYNIPQWKFLVWSPYRLSHKCCQVMKKNPVHEYGKQSGKVAITAQMADESLLRRQQWIRYGCNAFDKNNPISNPLSTWTEQDILQYIKQNNLPIASVYGEIVEDISKTNQLEGQMSFEDFAHEYGDFDIGNIPLKTTKCKRTGCMFCGFGCHLEKEGEGRFEIMKQTHPKQYEWIMKPWEDGGLGYKEIIDWLNENGNLHIRY